MANRIFKQSDGIFSGASLLFWCFEQAFPDLITQRVWDMIPFLEIAIVVGAFALGRNWIRVWPWLKSWPEPIECGTRIQGGSLHADLKFKRRCDNPKISLRIYGHDDGAIGSPCRYALLGRLITQPNASYNRGETLEVELLSKVPDPLQTRTKPNQVFSSGERFSRHQYRVLLEVTHSGWWPFRKQWDVYVPPSTHLEYLVGVVGMPCLKGEPEVSNDRKPQFIEADA